MGSISDTEKPDRLRIGVASGAARRVVDAAVEALVEIGSKVVFFFRFGCTCCRDVDQVKVSLVLCLQLLQILEDPRFEILGVYGSIWFGC